MAVNFSSIKGRELPKTSIGSIYAPCLRRFLMHVSRCCFLAGLIANHSLLLRNAKNDLPKRQHRLGFRKRFGI